MSQKKRIVLLGATGSIGDSTLQILRKYSTRLELIGIAAYSNYEKIAAIAREFEVPHVAITQAKAYESAKKSNAFSGDHTLYTGIEGLNQLASLPDADTVVVATVGSDGFYPTAAAIKAKKTIALASKEIMVMAGEYITRLAEENEVDILPLDSEHNAIFQCLQGHSKHTVNKIFLTASGGPFRNHPIEELQKVTPAEALKHPTWNMGPKVTTDCATLANKGLELIEAHYLFGIPAKHLEVLIHPQSIIHSLIKFHDGSFLAQLSPPHMTFPIQYALLYPERLPSVHPTLDFSEAFQLELSPPDTYRFPCLKLAQESMQAGGLAPTIFNAANEIAVYAFLNKQIGFVHIPILIDKALQAISNKTANCIDIILETHDHTCKTTTQFINEF